MGRGEIISNAKVGYEIVDYVRIGGGEKGEL
jgi:hypothetical protein